jgi:hypothetical protein
MRRKNDMVMYVFLFVVLVLVIIGGLYFTGPINEAFSNAQNTPAQLRRQNEEVQSNHVYKNEKHVNINKEVHLPIGK